MATYATYRHVELDNVGYGKKRVLKPPGGGSSDIFGAEETSPRRVKTHNQSQLGSALFGNANGTDNAHVILSPRSNKPDGNPVTGTGYMSSEMQKNGPAMQNGIASSNSSSSGEKSSDTSPAAKPRTRIPPGGYSSGLW